MHFPGKYVLYPVFVFLFVFGIDKICMIPVVKKLSQSDASYLYFDYKGELMDEMERVVAKLKSEPQPYPRKTVVILGSSRLLYFDYKRFARSFPDRELFNFSAPVTAPAYYYYILSKLEERGLLPDELLIEADPFQFNDGSNAFLKSNLAYSFDLPFIIRNHSLFTGDEISFYLSHSLFAGYRYPPKPDRILNRLKNPQDRYLRTFEEIDRFQHENRGGGKSIVPRENWFETDFARLEMTSRSTLDWLYGNYTVSERQFRFLEKIAELVKKHKIHTIFLRPPVSRPMQKMLYEDSVTKEGIVRWDHRFGEFIRRTDLPYLDLTADGRFYCNTFFDGSHMSLDCYHPLMIEVMRRFRSFPK